MKPNSTHLSFQEQNPSDSTQEHPLTLSFDIGHSSIGWSVLEKTNGRIPKICGTGVVIFPSNDCLASQRRGFRRQRRQAASVRNRVGRLRTLLLHLGVLSESELDSKPNSSPWLAAAQVLRAGRRLSWQDLWCVLRWYAHNRGYDGNRLWARQELENSETAEDVRKVQHAIALMKEHSTNSMAETVCSCLGLDPLKDVRASRRYFKGENAAFPRQIVENEVKKILELHVGKLPRLDTDFIKTICSDWRAIRCLGLSLPKRYTGGLLFGQFVPRFDNRIITRCRISGEKTPLKHCRSYYRFRWASLLANIRVVDAAGPRPLTGTERVALDCKSLDSGGWTPAKLRKAIKELFGCDIPQIDTYFLTSEMEEALIADPVRKALEPWKPLWDTLPEKVQKIAAGKLFRYKSSTIQSWRKLLLENNSDVTGFDQALIRLTTDKASRAKKAQTVTKEDILATIVRIRAASGRAPFSRQVMDRATEEIFSGKDPRQEGGALFEDEEIRKKLVCQPIDKQTNNHLIRHRLLILRRLLKNLVRRYAAGDKTRVRAVVVEVVRDIQEYAGLTAKEKAQLLGSKLSQHRRVAAKLATDLQQIGVDAAVSGSLIRKARIADDLGWTCPYTGIEYTLLDLVENRLQLEHIIPRSLRPSDSLESLVLTFREVNDWKGNRTAMEFIEEEQSNPVPGLSHLSIMTQHRFERFVEALKPQGPSLDDRRRCQRRKKLLLQKSYERNEREFTGRDLTITSAVNKLGAAQVRHFFSDVQCGPRIVHLPGAVTACLRKSWAMEDRLTKVCPLVLVEGKRLTKGEIREITHLHHALDAILQGLGATLFPTDGRFWEAFSRRRPERGDRAILQQTGMFQFSSNGAWRLRNLPDDLCRSIEQALWEKRVVMHIPSSMAGMRVQQNAWCVLGANGGKVEIGQHKPREGAGKRGLKIESKKPNRLLGYKPKSESKLNRQKSVLIIEENFGVALSTPPIVIPFHKVWPRIRALASDRSKIPPILRNGMIVKVASGTYEGVWRVHSIKDASAGIFLDMARPELVKAQNRQPGFSAMNVRLGSLMKVGLQIVSTDYSGP